MSKPTTEARDALFEALNGGGAAWRFCSTTAALAEWTLENLTAAGYAIVPAFSAHASLEAQVQHEHARAEEALAKKRELHNHVETQAARARAAEAQIATLVEVLEKALWRDDGVWTRTCSACGYHDAPNSDGHTHENINPWCWTHPLHRLLSNLSAAAGKHDARVARAAVEAALSDERLGEALHEICLDSPCPPPSAAALRAELQPKETDLTRSLVEDGERDRVLVEEWSGTLPEEPSDGR